MSTFKTTILLAACVILAGCISTHEAGYISAKYVSQETGGYVIFHADGKFYYSFANPSPPLAKDDLPRNLGRYYFNAQDDDVSVIFTRSAHAGLFAFRFSKSKDTLYVTNRAISPKEMKFVRE